MFNWSAFTQNTILFPPTGSSLVTRPWWRSVEIFRLVSLFYAVIAFALTHESYEHPLRVVVVLVVMCAWTIRMGIWLDRSQGLLVLDLLVVLAVAASGWWADDPQRLHEGASTIALTWVAAPVLAWAIAWGPLGGAAAAGAISVVNTALTWVPQRGMINAIIMLFFAGCIVGFGVQVVQRAHRALDKALAREAAAAERARLAADIHDSTLQALAYIQRRGHEIGGSTKELAVLAGRQEVSLRELVALGTPHVGQDSELMTQLRGVADGRAEVTGPQSVVGLSGETLHAVVGAVGAALDNVAQHAGEDVSAWISVDVAPQELMVVVRDNGPGCDPARLVQAKADGRLGVRLGIEGRIEGIGGQVMCLTSEGAGMEWEFTIPLTGQERVG